VKKQGYRIIEQNVRSRLGEIDLVAQDKDCLVFVEVRTRRAGDFTPEESVAGPKQRKLAALATQYVQKLGGAESDWRVDVIAIEIDAQDNVVRLDHLKSAVGEQPD
jgi:putative endonuclease